MHLRPDAAELCHNRRMRNKKRTYLRAAAIAAAFVLDAVLGDPPNWPHPVRLVGKQIEAEENLIRKYILPAAEDEAWPLDRKGTERLAGAALAADVALVSPLVTLGALKVLGKVHPALAFAGEVVLDYQLLATRSLADAGRGVHARLVEGNLEAARTEVGYIVGRDTDELDEEGVVRATVETIAENTSDGVIAPLLFMGIGGAPVAMGYKAVNTLDSMVGYKNEKYLNLGFAGAKLDDVVNFIPARISGALMCAAAAFTGDDPKRAWRIMKRDRKNHSSPNAAYTEAACAGALGVQLGGANRYFGKVVEKPTIGDPERPLETADIPRATKLMGATALLGLGASLVLALRR